MESDQPWSASRHLTNEERDEIDLQARAILTRCADRVKEMEALEKRETCYLDLNINDFSSIMQSVQNSLQASQTF